VRVSGCLFCWLGEKWEEFAAKVIITFQHFRKHHRSVYQSFATHVHVSSK
jgi:hypothetical protein